MLSDQLIQKYNIPVPRYTSYPPANLFSHQYGAEDLRADILQSNHQGARPISYYVHTPFCKRLCHFCACNKLPLPSQEREVELYFSYLGKEISLIRELLDPSRPLVQIHFGGGSPSSVPLRYITEVIDHLTRDCTVSPEAEIAIEIHPGYISREQWADLINHSFTRFSIGVQDFNPEILQTSNRQPSQVDISEIIQRIHDAGKRVNLDFIYGLPGQTADSFEQTIVQAINMRPDRLVTFSYAHVPWLHPQQSILEKKGLPTIEEKKEMYDRASQLMLDAGYVAIGLDHFVLPDDPLAIALQKHTLHRNFQGYCPLELSGQVYALGITGISQLHNSYAQSLKELKPYYQALDLGQLPTFIGYQLSPDESLARDIIADLMCNYRCNPLKHAQTHGREVPQLSDLPILQLDRLHEMAHDGLLSISDDSTLVINPDAHLFVRNVASTFDMHYNPENPKGYSKPI